MTLSGTRTHGEVVGERLDHHALGRSQRMEFDEILLVDKAARRRQRGDDEELVADVGIGDLVHVLGVVERDRDARPIGPDQIAGDVQRVRRLEDGIADIQRPYRAVGGDAGQARTVELQPHDVGVAALAEIVAANGAARLAVERAQIDRGLGIEHDPQRVGAMKHRHSDGRLEGERQFQVGALLAELDGDLAGAVGLARCGRRRRRGLACFVRHSGRGLRRNGGRSRRNRCVVFGGIGR